MKEIVKFDTPELQVIEKSKAEQIKKTFEPMVEMLTGFESDFNKLMSIPIEEMTLELTQKYKKLRLDIGKVRTETGKIKDKQKEYIKLEDRAIMGVHNILVWAVKEKEDKLKEREDHFDMLEQNRLEALQSERVEKLSAYIEDAHERDLVKFADDEFEALLAMKKKQHEDGIAAEKKAEEDRIAKEKAEADERERIRLDNIRLTKEMEERVRNEKIEAEKRAKAEEARLKKAESERKAREEKERKEREAYELELKKQREKNERKEAELKAKADTERKAREEAENELRLKREATQKSIEEEEVRIQSELNMIDTAKVISLNDDLANLKTKYSFKSKINQKMYSVVGILIDKIINHVVRDSEAS